MKNIDYKRSIAHIIVWKLYGLPYKWGGDDTLAGFDCSGAIIEVLKSVGILPNSGDWTAQGLCDMFTGEKVIPASTGCLAFYGRDRTHITHVMFCISSELAIGAIGGGSKTKTKKDAERQNAYIKVRPIDYRKDLVCVVDPFQE